MRQILLPTLFLLSSLSAFAQNDSEQDSLKAIKQPNFTGWTEEQIKHYEDSLIAKLYPTVYEMTLDSLSIDRKSTDDGNSKTTTPAFTAPILTSYNIDETLNVGEIPIQSGMSPSGAKTYTIPIEVYQGMRRMQPELTLTYNSQAGNSYVGMGWSLSGIPTITRAGKTVYYDNQTEAVALDTTDVFLLDGMHLIRRGKDADCIRYESETGRIKAKGYYVNDVIKYFEVFYPSGQKGVFGYANNTQNRLEYPLISRSDLFGNTITHSYSFSENKYHITSITYNGASVLFTYDNARADTLLAYARGLKVRDPQLLKTIVCKNGNTVLHTYTLTHSEQNGHSLFTRLDYSVGTESYNPLQFYYGTGNTDNSYSQQTTHLFNWHQSEQMSEIKSMTGRFDYWSGTDGLATWPGRNPYWVGFVPGSPENRIWFRNLFTGNENIFLYSNVRQLYNSAYPLPTGEGFIDLIHGDIEGKQDNYIIKINNTVVNDSDQMVFKVYQLSSNIFGDPVLSLKYTRTYQFNTVHTNSHGDKNIQPKYYFTGDFNGDGRAEVLAVSVNQPLGDTNLPSKCYIFDLQNDCILYQQNLFAYNKEFIGVQQTDAIEAENNSDKLFVMDYDGDGKTDICHINDSGTRIYSFSTSASTVTARLVGTYTGLTKADMEDRRYLPGEYNGDGLTDLLITPSSESQSNHIWTLYNSKGNGQFESHTFYGPSNQNNMDCGFIIQDVDGDGTTDLVDYNTNTFNTSFTRNNTPNANQIVTNFATSGSLFVQADINDQKSMSKLLSMKNGIVTRYSFSKNQRKENMMTRVQNSYGTYEKNTYVLLNEADSETYVQGANAVFPYMDLCESIPVLYSNAIYVRNSQKEKHEYRYVKAIAHRQGRGFMGFKQIDRYYRGKIYTKTFDPYRYNVQTSEVTPFANNSYTYAVTTAANRIAKIKLTEKVERNLLKEDTITTSYNYNSYDYPIREEVLYGGGLSTLTTRNYLNQNNAWDGYYLGFLYHEDRKVMMGTDSVCTSWRYTNFEAPMRPKYKQNLTNNAYTERHVYGYDSLGNVISDGIKYDTSTSYLITYYTYDSQGRLTNITDPLGLTTQYTYNAKGQKATMVDKRGETTTYTYDSFGRDKKAIYPDGRVEEVNRTWEVSSDGTVYAITRTHSGQPTTITYYDAFNRENRHADKRYDGVYRYVDKEYDNRGRLHRESPPHRYTGSGSYFPEDSLWNTYEYDDYDRLTSQTVNGLTTTFSYNGHSITETTNGQSTTKTHDVLDRLISVTDSTGTITYNLAPDGQPKSITVSGGGTTQFTYNTRRRPTLIKEPCSGNTRFYYNAMGKVSKKTNAKNEATLYTYDIYGRLITKTCPEMTTTYTYDALNDLTKIENTNGVKKHFTYNRFGQLWERTDSIGDVWLHRYFNYDANNPVNTSYTSSNGFQTHETRYYPNGHFAQGWQEGYYIYYDLRAENEMGLPTELKTQSVTRRYEYDDYGRQTRRSAVINNQYYQDISYEISPQFLCPTQREDNLHQTSETFGYDNLCRLNRIGNQNISYDLKGNITSWDGVGTFNYTSTYKPYTLSGITNPGSLVPQTPQDITYTSFSRPDSIMGNGYTAAFVYDEEGNRVKMTVSKNDTVVSTHYYIGNSYEMIVDSTAQVTENVYYFGDYYHATAVCQRTGVYNTKTYNILRDNLGSITHIIREDGQLIQELSYDAWGRLRDPQTLAVYAPGQEPTLFLGRGYTGHEHLQEFGLINMNARLYDPAIGRFLSPDPYVQMPENSQNFNRYSYCLNNPLKYTDESGEFIFTALLGPVGIILDGMCWGAVIGAGTAAISYSLSTWISGGSWNSGNFWKSVGMGAVGGAIGGAFGGLGTMPMMGTFGNTFGYNTLSSITNMIATNVIFGNETNIGDILPLIAGSLAGANLPTYQAIQGSPLQNCLAEMTHNTARGAITGFVSGLVSSQVHSDNNRIWQNLVGGAIGGASRTLAMNIIMGSPFYTDNKYGTKGLYRSGGLASLLTKYGNGLTLGQNMYIDSRNDQNALYHENYHIQQQYEKGWAGFYGIIAMQYASQLIQFRNPAGCELEREAYEYGNTHAPYPY